MISASDQLKLFKAQKACIRLVCGKKKNHNSELLYKELKVLTFPDIIQMELCK